MTNPGYQRASGPLLALLIALSGVVALTDAVVLPLSSWDGRLVLLSPEKNSLALAHYRVQLPSGHSWSGIRLRCDLHDDEAISLILHKKGDAMVVLRLSRHARLSQGLATYRDGVLTHIEPLPPGLCPGTLDLRQDASGLRLSSAGSAGPGLVVAPQLETDAFEVTMFPPDSTMLTRRISLDEVRLDDGSTLHAPPLWSQLRPRTGLLAAILGGLVLLRRRLCRLPARLFAHHWRERPRDLVWMLACFNCVPALLLAKAQVQGLPTAEPIQRTVFGGFVLVGVFAFLGFGHLRDRLLEASVPLRQSWFMHRILLLPSLLVFTVVWSVALSLGFRALVIERPARTVQPPGAAALPRIAFVGGSVTRGYPYDEDGPDFFFPQVVQARLQARGLADALCYNLGIDAAGSAYIRSHLRQTLGPLATSQVVVTAVVNDGTTAPATYRANMEEILAASARAGASKALVVKELERDGVYTDDKGPLQPLYKVLDGLGAAGRAVVVDPLPDFVAHRDEFLFIDGVHLTARGHALLAEIIARHL